MYFLYYLCVHGSRHYHNYALWMCINGVFGLQNVVVDKWNSG